MQGFVVESIVHIDHRDHMPTDLKHVWRKTLDGILSNKCVTLITWKNVKGRAQVEKRMVNVKAYVNGVGLEEERLKASLARNSLNKLLKAEGIPFRVSNVYIRPLSRPFDRRALSNMMRIRREDSHSNLNKAEASLKCLPYTLIRHIASYLPVRDSVLAGQICRDWYVGIDQEAFFQLLYDRDIGCLDKTEADLDSYKKRTIHALSLLHSKRSPKTLQEQLWSASRMGYYRIIQRIIEDDSNNLHINVKLANRATLLETACHREHLNLIKWLIHNLGADPYVGADNGDSCMHLCVCCNRIKSVMVLVEECGCEPSRFPTLLTGPLYSNSKEFKDPAERIKMLAYLLRLGFRRPRDIVDNAIAVALEKERIFPEQLEDLHAKISGALLNIV